MQHPDLFINTLTLLATQGWEKSDDVDFADVALNSLSMQFLVPHEQAEVDVALFKEEWEDIVLYARRYLTIRQSGGSFFNAAYSNKYPTFD